MYIAQTQKPGITVDELGSARDPKVPAEGQQSQEKMCRLDRLAQLSSDKGLRPMRVLESWASKAGLVFLHTENGKEPVRKAVNLLTPEASSVTFVGFGLTIRGIKMLEAQVAWWPSRVFSSSACRTTRRVMGLSRVVTYVTCVNFCLSSRTCLLGPVQPRTGSLEVPRDFKRALV